MTIEFTAPIRIESEANRRDHWAAKKKRADAQTKALWASWTASPHRGKGLHARMDYALPLPAVVTFTRIGPRRLDSDNLAGGFKRVRDCLTQLAGWPDDGDERITWCYHQEKGKPKEFAIRVRIEAPRFDYPKSELQF